MEEKKKKVNGKKKGNAYELVVAAWHKAKGWMGVVSSRSESKRKDDAGVDLCYTDPFNIQAKAWESAPSYHKVLNKMPKDHNINLLFHKRNRQGTIVVMTLEDWDELLDMMILNGIIKPR